VVLEDLHWADETSLNLLAFISRQIAGWAVVVVATAREEELTPRLGRLLGVIDEQGGTTVRLGRLSRPATVSLVHGEADHPPRPRILREHSAECSVALHPGHLRPRHDATPPDGNAVDVREHAGWDDGGLSDAG